jgi:hypothetical protein
MPAVARTDKHALFRSDDFTAVILRRAAQLRLEGWQRVPVATPPFEARR